MNLSWGAFFYDNAANDNGIQATNDNHKSFPMYGSSQALSLTSGNWNRMYDVIFQVPETRQMFLRRMRPDARLIAIEMNPEFVSFLRKTLVDERFQVVEASAADVKEIMQKFGHAKADYIISGIPLGSMPKAIREPILHNTCEALAAGGSFLVFQFTTRVLPDLTRVFRYVKRKFEPLNILPAHLFICQPGTA